MDSRRLAGPVVLPAPERPRVSLIILAWRQTDLLLACLASLATQHTATTYETVVVLNGASDEVADVVDRHVLGARILRSPVNLGFGGGCNLAATVARGEYLVMVNDDTQLDPGWLDALVTAADDNPDAGAVGSRIHDPEDLLQEAGGILWSDGSIWHVGRLLPKTTRRYRSMRTVDYCSACSLLVRRTTWDAVGGFDDAYFPGYYEDLDLCLSIAALGQRILYQPAARLLHHGGGDSGSLDHLAKAFVARRSRAHFLAKWDAALRRQPSPPTVPPPAAEAMDTVERAVQLARRQPLRALVVDHRLTDPPGAPGLERLVDVLADLAGSGYVVTAWSPQRPGPHHDRLGARGVDLAEDDLDAHLSRPSTLYDAVLVMGATALWASAQAVRRHQPQAALVCQADEPLPAWVAQWVDAIVTVAPALPPLPDDDVRPGFDERRDLLVVAPDPEWLERFTHDTLPAITHAIPWARLRVSGPAPQALAGPSVQLLGQVDDPFPLYAGARAVLAPTAMHATAAAAHGVPVAADAADAVALLTDRRTWARRAAAAAALPRVTASRNWADALDHARRNRPSGRARAQPAD